MIHHAGLLDDNPSRNPLFNWARSSNYLSRMPEDIATSLRVWFLTPGISVEFHRHALNISPERMVMHDRDAQSHREALMPKVSENWLSVERPDAVKLSHYRAKNMHIPLLVRMQLVKDIKAGMKQIDLADEYRINHVWVNRIWRNGPFYRAVLPDWFSPALF